MVSGDKKVFLDINIFRSSPISSIFYALSIAFILSNKVLFAENMGAMKCSQSTLALYRINYKKKKKRGTLGLPWQSSGLRLHASNVGGMGSIAGQGIKIPGQMAWSNYFLKKKHPYPLNLIIITIDIISLLQVLCVIGVFSLLYCWIAFTSDGILT